MKDRKVFFYCYDHNRPTGGQKHTYEQVDILNNHGFNAYAVHGRAGFRLTWFRNRTQVIYHDGFTNLYHPERDILVLPEDMGSRILKVQGWKVIFDKNIYHGFQSLGIAKCEEYPYLSRDVLAVMTVSEHNMRYLKFAYPSVEVVRVQFSIDTDQFRLRPWLNKRPCLMVTPKGERQMAAVLHTLWARGHKSLNRACDFDLVVASELPEHKVASALQDCPIFLFLNIEEGLGRMPLEAMACGAVAIGYGCGPLVETLPSACRFAYDDIIGVCEFIERLMDGFISGRSVCDDVLIEASKKIAEFSRVRQEESVLQAWQRIFALASARSQSSIDNNKACEARRE